MEALHDMARWFETEGEVAVSTLTILYNLFHLPFIGKFKTNAEIQVKSLEQIRINQVGVI